MPSASGKGGVTEIRLAFLPKNSPYPSPLSVPPAKKKKKIKGIKCQFSRHWKSGSERWETNKVSPTLGPADCFQSFQAEHKEGIWGQLLGLWRCCWVSMESKAARVHRTHLVVREVNTENPGVGKHFFQVVSWVLIWACLWRNARHEKKKKPWKRSWDSDWCSHGTGNCTRTPSQTRLLTRLIENTQRRLCLTTWINQP